MADLTVPTTGMKPCPFCGAILLVNDDLADLYVRRYGAHYEHPDNGCWLSGDEVRPSEVESWNTRTDGVPVVQPQQEKNVELPDAIRVPLDELEADAAYIIGRVAVDGSCSGIMVEAIRKRTRAIREALLAHGAQGSARDHNEVMALVYLYGSHCAEHPEDAAGQQERLAGVKTALGVEAAAPKPSTGAASSPINEAQPATPAAGVTEVDRG